MVRDFFDLKMHPHTKFGIPTSNSTWEIGSGHDILKNWSEVKFKVTVT